MTTVMSHLKLMANRAYDDGTDEELHEMEKERQRMEAEAERGMSHRKLVVFLVTALQSLLWRKTLLQI